MSQTPKSSNSNGNGNGKDTAQISKTQSKFGNEAQMNGNGNSAPGCVNSYHTDLMGHMFANFISAYHGSMQTDPNHIQAIQRAQAALQVPARISNSTLPSSRTLARRATWRLRPTDAASFAIAVAPVLSVHSVVGAACG